MTTDRAHDVHDRPELAVVTGCHGGLGAHVVRALADQGFEVVGVGRRAEADLPEGVHYLQVDAGDPDAAAALVAGLPRTPSLVVHTASVYPRSDGDLSADELGAAFHVNAVHPYLVDLAVLSMPRLPSTSLTLVSVSSEAMFHADAGSGAYAATKAALRVLTAAVADRCRGSGAAACVVTLGPLLTPTRETELRRLAERHSLDVADVTAKALARSNPDLVIDRFIELDACVRSILHLHELGVHANGSVLRLDGGSAGSLI